MSFLDDPLIALKERRRRFFRRFVIAQVAGGIIASATLVWFDYFVEGGRAWWILLYAALVVPGTAVAAFWAVRRANDRTFAFFEALRPRLRQGNASGRGPASSLLLDNGIVLGLGQGVGVVSFQRYFDASGRPIQPNAQDLVAWSRKIRNLPAITVTKVKGPPATREGLERFKTQVNARWARMFLHESRKGSGSNGFGLRARVTLVVQIPRLLSRGADVLNVLDQVRTLLDDSYHALTEMAGSPGG